MVEPRAGASETATHEEITQLLRRCASKGDQRAREALAVRVHDSLRHMAQQHMAAERAGHTLQPTALVHEVYIKLLGGKEIDWNDRAHFYRAAADAMRRTLIDHARTRGRGKRGGGRRRAPASVLDLIAVDDSSQIVAIDDAIRRLEADDPRAAEVVRLRFFAGLSVEETARTLDVSIRTVLREWAVARAWLYRVLSDLED